MVQNTDFHTQRRPTRSTHVPAASTPSPFSQTCMMVPRCPPSLTVMYDGPQVSVRGASGAYIPGTLSKLSGGQYRRASLVL